VRTGKKISYPSLITIELVSANNLGPLKLITNEVRAGEVILIECEDNRYKKVYKVNSEINQIYGDFSQNDNIIELYLADYIKKNKIEEYIKILYDNISVNELIIFKNDFEDFENEIIKYLLLTKRKDNLEYKKLRSICFKTIKNAKLAERMSYIIKHNIFDFFENTRTKFVINFETLNVQLINE
jgi:hypothetical protein